MLLNSQPVQQEQSNQASCRCCMLHLSCPTLQASKTLVSHINAQTKANMIFSRHRHPGYSHQMGTTQNSATRKQGRVNSMLRAHFRNFWRAFCVAFPAMFCDCGRFSVKFSFRKRPCCVWAIAPKLRLKHTLPPTQTTPADASRLQRP